MSTSRTTFKHAAIYSMASMLAKAVGFIMLPFYAHILKGEGYGVIGMLDASTGFLVMLLGYGLNSTYTRFYHEEPEANRGRVVSSGVTLLWTVSLPIVGILLLAARPATQLLLGDPSHALVFKLALLTFALDITGQACSTILMIQRRSVIYSATSLLRLVLGLSLNIWLIVVRGMGVTGYFLSALIVAAVSTIIYHVLAYRTCGWGFDRELMIRMLKFQLPMVPGNLVSFFSRQVERVLLRVLINLESVGVLEMGGKFPSLIPLLVTQPFMRSWNTERVRIAEQPEAPALIGRMFTKFLLLAVFAGLMMAVNIRAVLEVLTPEEFWPAWRIARIEIVGLLLSGCYYHMMFGLYYHKKTGKISTLRAGTSLGKIGLSWLFITTWGLAGAAWSSTLTWAVLVVWTGILSQRLYPIRLEWGRISLIVGWALILDQICLRAGLDSTAFAGWIRVAALPWLATMIANGPLGELKEGKLPTMFIERAIPLSSMIINTMVASLNLLLFPLFHDGARRKIQLLLRRSRTN